MSAGAIAGGIVGGVVGFFVGGPAGAAIGFGIGMSAGGLLDPVKGPSQPGPQLNDKNFQTAKYGDMLARFYGTIAVAGNVTWIENGKLRVRFRKKKSGGKGGGSAKAAPVAYYSATFFLSLGLGPIAGIRRIWCSDKLIYNAGSDDLETIIASNQVASGFKVYLGTDDQLPDPRYEADVGVGNAPAYRGEAYIAFYDFQLADFGNSLQGAQFKVEVVTASDDPGLHLVETLTSATSKGFELGCYAPFGSEALVKFYSADNNWFNTPDYYATSLQTSGSAQQSILVPENPRSAISGKYSEQKTPLWRNDGTGAMRYASSLYPYSFSVLDWAADGLDLFILTSTELNKIAPGPGVALSVAVSGYMQMWKEGGVIYLFKTGTTLVIDPESMTVLETRVNSLTLSGTTTTGGGDGRIYLASGSAATSMTTLQRLNTAATAVEDSFTLPSFDDFADQAIFAVRDNVLLRAGAQGSDFTCQLWSFARVDSQQVPLAGIVEQEIALSSLLTAADVDTSLLTAQVRGYRVSGGSIRSALEPPQGTWPFDMIQSGYALKPVPRGQASVMNIPWEDLGASDGDTPGELLQESREMDSQLPARTSIKYLDASREYAIAEQSVSRDNTPAINRVDRELPIVLTADEAAGVADVLQNLAWLERSEYAFSLPPTYLMLEPADVVTIEAPWATFELRITEINYASGGRLECKARPNRAALYSSSAKGGEGVPPSGEIPLAGPALTVLLDIPVVDETIQNSPGFGLVMAGYNPDWPGGVLFRSPDTGQTWQDLQGFDGFSTLGFARTALASDPGYIIDRDSVLIVDLVAGELESITEDQMLNSRNIFAYGADGRWELIMAANCVLQADGSYQLSTFVRGWKGTEWATGLHQACDLLVLLDDPDNVFVDTSVASLGLDMDYRGVTAGASIESAPDVPFTYQGVNLKPLSVVYVTGTRDGSQNLAIDAVRRSRLSSSWWVTGVPAPVGEATETYEIDIMSGATVKRTLTGSSFPITYSAADQTADFGSPLASVTLNIYQKSAVVGRGYARNATV